MFSLPGETRAETIVTGSAPLSRLRGAGLGGEVQHYLSGGGEVVDYSVSLGAKHMGGAFDAKGNRWHPQGYNWESSSTGHVQATFMFGNNGGPVAPGPPARLVYRRVLRPRYDAQHRWQIPAATAKP